MILCKHLGYDLTENVFAKNNRFSKEMNPAPLFGSNIHEQRIREYIPYATKRTEENKEQQN